jgi:hypothetical protein
VLASKPLGSSPHFASDPRKMGLIAFGAFWVAAVAWAVWAGPRLYAEASQQAQVEAEAESRDVCQRLGMPFGSSGYSGCASELNVVRQQHEYRTARRSAGIL